MAKPRAQFEIALTLHRLSSEANNTSRLDKENPRLAAVQARATRRLIKKLWDEMAVDELALSIAANGYSRGAAIVIRKRR